MQKYELTIVFKPLLFEDLKNNVIKKIGSEVKSLGGKFKEVDNMGKKLLAYEIKTFKEGYYVEYELEIDPVQLEELRTVLNITQDVLRFLIIQE